MLFNERGVANTTLNDIAKCINMTRGAVYWHFQNKDDIIIALWKRDAQELQSRFERDLQLRNSTDPIRQFKESVHHYVLALAESPHIEQVIRVVSNSQEVIENETVLQQFLRQTRVSFFDSIEQAFQYLAERRLLNPALTVRYATRGLWSYMQGPYSTECFRITRKNCHRRMKPGYSWIFTLMLY